MPESVYHKIALKVIIWLSIVANAKLIRLLSLHVKSQIRSNNLLPHFEKACPAQKIKKHPVFKEEKNNFNP